MAEATVSMILEQMTTITIDKAIEAWSLVQGAEKEVKRLETNFKAHRLELEDAEEKEYVDKRVKLWLDKFRYVSYDMEDVLDEWETAVQQLQTDLSGSASVRNWKIQCRGRDAVPENASVNTFVYEVLFAMIFFRNKIFSEARPPGIYKPDYIDALYAFYHERRPESLVCPPTPEWKRSYDLDLNGEATADDDDDDDDDDDGAPTALPVRGHAQFPGSHPVSLNRSLICLNTLIQDGKEMASVLYTYRSCVEALPQGVCWNSQFGIQKRSAETGAASIYCGFWF
ncbi:hypothetical protein PVK06_026715 [Gossypium arboreum]|uniref:Disease resistance N-terminal domain-containing protein n=1 Tax=Gossypium arboreum TaxID=29729 RepID=A0ABR0NYE2_GOSAR|nr:hypothetical protein PVK06_026715 [Gossypium arboreum]